MWHEIFAQEVPFADKVIRTVLIYALLAVLIRVTGKRGLAGLNTLDVVVIFLLSNVVQNAVIGPDNSVTGGAIGAVTLTLVNSLVNRAALISDRFGRLFDGTDTEIINRGQINVRAARRLGLRRGDLEHAVRLQNGENIGAVDSGVLDPGGQLILSLKASELGATKSDIDQLRAQLAHIEAMLTDREP